MSFMPKAHSAIISSRASISFSALERVTKENHIDLIRDFIPKEKKISDDSPEAIARVEGWTRGFPRKILGNKTLEELNILKKRSICYIGICNCVSFKKVTSMLI